MHTVYLRLVSSQSETRMHLEQLMEYAIISNLRKIEIFEGC